MAAVGSDLESVELTEREHWLDGPPHELFKQLRGGCPIHWTESFEEFPDEAGLLVGDDRRGHPHGQPRLAHVLLRTGDHRGGRAPDRARARDVHRHGPAQARSPEGAVPGRLHAEADRRPRGCDPGDRASRCSTACTAARAATSSAEVAQPVVARVIGSFMGIAEEDDEIWARLMNSTLGAGDPDVNPDGIDGALEKDIPEIFERCAQLIAERREHPTDDLTSVLVHAEVDGEKLEEHEIVMGFFLLMAAGNDSTKATFCSAMRALMEDREQMQALLEDPSLIPSAVEESLRMFPAFAHFRRTATCDTELHGQKIRAGEKVVLWYASSNRDETRYEDPDHFDVRRNPEHQAFGAGGRHFCLGTALARLELKIMLEETLARYPRMQLAGAADRTSNPPSSISSSCSPSGSRRRRAGRTGPLPRTTAPRQVARRGRRPARRSPAWTRQPQLRTERLLLRPLAGRRTASRSRR